jgi:hypothetical protein
VLAYQRTQKLYIVTFCKRRITLKALHVRNMQSRHFRRLLEAMHTNTSIKELHIFIYGDGMQALCGADGGMWIATLLCHKTDFVDLTFHVSLHRGQFGTCGMEGWAKALALGL